MVVIERGYSHALWPRDFLAANHSERVATRGRVLHPADLPGFVAVRDAEPIALATYLVEGDECELVTLHSAVENSGAGSALIERVASVAREAGCGRLCLVTTNDNTHAIRFYQRRGFRIATVRPGRIDQYRQTLKPEIPAIGLDGIPIRDEIEFELNLE